MCIPTTSGVSETTACPQSPIADDPSALSSLPSAPSSSQWLCLPVRLTTPRVTAVVLYYCTFHFCCCCSFAQSCLTFCNPMDCSTLGFPVLHHLLDPAQTHALSWWCPPTISSSLIPFSSCLQSLPASGSFLMSWLFTSGGQSIGASTSDSVLPMNIQGWFPLGWIGWISLQSKGLSRVFSNTTVQKHQFFGAQLSL